MVRDAPGVEAPMSRPYAGSCSCMLSWCGPNPVWEQGADQSCLERDVWDALQVPLGYHSLFWAPEPVVRTAHPTKFSELRSRQHIQALSEDLEDRQVPHCSNCSCAAVRDLAVKPPSPYLVLNEGWNQRRGFGSRLPAG